MALTSIRSEQIGDGEVRRSDLNVTDASESVVSAVTVNSPLTSTDGIGLAGTGDVDISIPAADTSTSGYLSFTDWNTFNDKPESMANLSDVTLTSQAQYDVLYATDASNWSRTNSIQINPTVNVTVNETLVLGTNSITMTGDLAETGSRISSGYFTNLYGTNLTIGSATAVTDVDTDLSSVAAGHTTLASALAIKTYVDNAASLNLGDLGNVTDGSAQYDILYASAASTWENTNSIQVNPSTSVNINEATTINSSSSTALVVEDSGVNDNVFVVDTANNSVGIGTTPNSNYLLYLSVNDSSTTYGFYGAFNFQTNASNISASWFSASCLTEHTSNRIVYGTRLQSNCSGGSASSNTYNNTSYGANFSAAYVAAGNAFLGSGLHKCIGGYFNSSYNYYFGTTATSDFLLISGDFGDPAAATTSGNMYTLSARFQGDVLLYSDKKLYFEHTNIAGGADSAYADSYMVYNSSLSKLETYIGGTLEFQIGGTTSVLNSTLTLGGGDLYFDDSTVTLSRDGSDNLVFTDGVETGGLTLSDCAKAKLIRLVEDNSTSGFSESTDYHISDATNWNASKAIIKEIIFETSSTDWDFWILQNDNGYATNDATVGRRKIVSNANGDQHFVLDLYYEDEDDTNEVHFYYVDNSGANTLDKITILATEAR